METVPIFVKVPAAARLLGLGKTKTYELVAAGVIPSKKFDSAILVPRAWIEQQATDAIAAAQFDRDGEQSSGKPGRAQWTRSPAREARR